MTKKTDLIKQSKARIVRYCANAEKAPSKVLSKLVQYGLNDKEAQSILKYLIESNFVNEKRFSNAFVNDKLKLNQWGRNKIRMALQKLHIEQQYIEQSLDSICLDEYQQIMSKLINKKMSTLRLEENQYLTHQKILRFMFQKGFEQELVEKYIDDC